MGYIGGTIVGVGDSITLGFNADFSWCDQIVTDLGVTLHNTALTGSGWDHDPSGVAGGATSLANRAASTVDIYVGNSPQPFLFLFAGTNDIFWGYTAAQTITVFQAYVQARLNAGWIANRIIVNTMLSRSTVAEADRATYNAAQIAGASTYGYLLSRLDQNVNIGGPNAYQDTTYFGDGTHPTDAGQRIIAAINEAAHPNVIMRLGLRA